MVLNRQELHESLIAVCIGGQLQMRQIFLQAGNFYGLSLLPAWVWLYWISQVILALTTIVRYFWDWWFAVPFNFDCLVQGFQKLQHVSLSLRVVRWLSFANMSVCRVALKSLHINWFWTLVGIKSLGIWDMKTHNPMLLILIWQYNLG